MTRQSCPDAESCVFAKQAQASALEAIETAGAAVGMASTNAETVKRIDKRTQWQGWVQIVLLALIPLAIAYVAWKTSVVTNDHDETVKDCRSAVRNDIEDRFRVEQQSKRDVFLTGYRQGADEVGRQVRDDILAQLPMFPQTYVKAPKKPAPPR